MLNLFFNNNELGRSNQANRIKWVQKTLKKIPKGKSILDAGAGEQQYKKFCKHLKYTSQDIAEYNGQGDEQGLQTKSWDFGKLDIISDITKIPRKDKSFDAIMCTEVFEHIVDPVKALEEFNRLLKPGGYLILSSPFNSLTHFSPYHYSTGFNKYFYKFHLERLNFSILDLSPNGNYFEVLAQELHRYPSVSKRYSNYSPGFLFKLARQIILKNLSLSLEKDSGSDELQCYGYHVLARKNK